MCTFSTHIHTNLHAFAVVKQHVAELFGHHVQMPLFALVGPGQNVELGEVQRQIIERSRANTKKLVLLRQNPDTHRQVNREAYWMVVNTGSSSVRNTKGSSL